MLVKSGREKKEEENKVIFWALFEDLKVKVQILSSTL